MTTRHAALVLKLAGIDQNLAAAYELGDDATLKMREFLDLCETIQRLEQLRSNVEAELNGQ
jgi:hypothetical protein